MPTPITTDGLEGGPISTGYLPPESVSEWVKRHDEDVLASTPAGNELRTSWASAGGTQLVRTARNPGESDTDFLDRHIISFLVLMIEEPPAV